jgi:3-oxoacyl-[acyl-carrier-protein] synthase-3
MGTSIGKIEYFLPETIITNDDLAKKFSDLSSKKVHDKVGIRQRHIAEEEETALDLAVKAAEKLFATEDKKDVDFVLLCTQSPDYFLPTSACILQDRLGLNTNVGAFDINLGCSGYVYALAVSKGLISTGVAKKVLLITAETYSKHINPEDKSNRIIFGDAAAATIVESSETENIHEFVFGTDGRGYDKLIVKNGGMRNRRKELSDSNVSDDYLFMDGPEIFNFTIESLPRVFNELLAKNHVGMDDLNHVIFHQANKYMLDYLRKKIKIPDDIFYVDIEDIGNTVSSTIPIAIKRVRDTGIVKEGDLVLLLGFGVGYSWGGTIVRL